MTIPLTDTFLSRLFQSLKSFRGGRRRFAAQAIDMRVIGKGVAMLAWMLIANGSLASTGNEDPDMKKLADRYVWSLPLEIDLGTFTNNLSAGIAFSGPQPNYPKSQEIVVEIMWNDVRDPKGSRVWRDHRLYIPSDQSSKYAVSLNYSDGTPVKRKAAGIRQGLVPPKEELPGSVSPRKGGVNLFVTFPQQVGWFRIEDLFILDKEDTYELTVKVRLIQKIPGKEEYRVVFLNPVSLKLKLAPLAK